MPSSHSQQRLQRYRQKQMRRHLQERLKRCLGSAVSEVEVVLKARAHFGDGSKKLTIFSSNILQMHYLAEFVLQNANANRWIVWIGSDYPEVVLTHEFLMKYIWKLIDEFELLAVRKPRSRTSSMVLDKEDYYICVIGKRWCRLLYDHYANMVMREYSWNLFANGSPFEGSASFRAKMFSKGCRFMGCLLAGKETELVDRLMSKIYTILVGVLGRKLDWNGSTIADRSTKQWLRAEYHSHRALNDAIWRVEVVGQSFIDACKRALSEIRPAVLTKIESL